MNTILANLRHNLWANERMFEACLPLTEEQLATEASGTFGRLDAASTRRSRTCGAFNQARVEGHVEVERV